MKDTLEVVLQGGALGLLALVLFAALYVVLAVVPSIKAFFERLTAFLAGIETRIAVLDTKVDSVVKAESENAAALQKLVGDLQEEAGSTRDTMHATERRLTATILRQQTSEPPPPASRPSLVGARPARAG